MNIKKSYESYFNKSTSDIPFLRLLYVISIPLAMIFIKLKFKPNTITTLSNISALISFYFIIIENSYFIFLFFWLMALLFDICDGIVSRKTSQQSPQGSFYDHFTDQIKVLLLFLSAGIYYHTNIIWILTFITSTTFLLYSLLSYMLRFRMKILTINIENHKNSSFKINNKVWYIFKRYFYNNVFIMQGNFVVYLSFIFIEEIVVYIFSTLILIILFNLMKSIKHMNKVNNDLQNNNLKWS